MEILEIRNIQHKLLIGDVGSVQPGSFLLISGFEQENSAEVSRIQHAKKKNMSSLKNTYRRKVDCNIYS